METVVPVCGLLGIIPCNDLDRYRSCRSLFEARVGHRGIKAARAQYDAWRAIAEAANWKTPGDVKKAHPKPVCSREAAFFNIKANDYRLVALVQYLDGVLLIRFFGSHAEYDRINAETV